MIKFGKSSLKLDFITFCLIVYFIFNILAGPIRYNLNEVGLSFLSYTPNLLLVMAFGYSFLQKEYLFQSCLVLYAALIYSVVSLLNSHSILQILLGINIFIPIIFGFIYSKKIIAFMMKSNLALFLFCAASLGLFINYFIAFPWSGLVTEIGDYQIQSSLFWSTSIGDQAFVRLAGFARVSYEAAAQILIFALVVNMQSNRNFIKSTVFVIALLACALTTAKITFIAVVLILIFEMFYKYLGRLSRYIILGIFTILLVILPLSSLIISYKTYATGPIGKFIFSSLEDRAQNTWPGLLSYLEKNSYYIFGSGIGGIGVPQIYFDNANFSPGDNLFLYLLATFGLLAFSLFILVPIRLLMLDNKKTSIKTEYLIYLTIIVLGITTNVIELSIISLVMGVVIGNITKSNIKMQVKNNVFY